jgi:ABC-2 type transport system permease protein
MKSVLVTLFGEVRKSLLISWTYRVDLLIGLLMFSFIFVGMGFLMGKGELNPEQLAFLFVGYLAWFYMREATGNLSWGLRGEMSAGTLEQMAMSPAPVGLILMGRVLANLILSTTQVLIQGSMFLLLLGMKIPLRWQGIPILALTLIGVSGFGYVVAGATLIFKQSESLANLVENVLLFINGTMVPIDAMPSWLVSIAKTLPSTQGIVLLRRVVLDGQPLASSWQDGSLIWLIAHSAIYVTAGWLFFGFCERIAKEQGSLGQY